MTGRPKPTAIGLFAGAGGLDTGLQAAGFRIALAVERDAICCATLRANHGWKVVEKDLVDTTPQELLKAGKLRRRQVDLISAGPPCQPFSKSANWAPTGVRRLRDPRSATLHNLMDLIGHVLPRCVLIENVEGFRRGGLRLVSAGLRQINRVAGTSYRASWTILNAADYGVPQKRRRFFLVAFRDGRDFEFPEATHINNPVTCWDAIGQLSKRKRSDLALKGRWAKLLPSIPEGRNYLWHTNRGGGDPLFGWRTKYWSFLLKLAKNEPAWTIPAQPAQNAGPFHWCNRQLTTAEMLKLQTFQIDTFLAGSRADRQRQIGNAVPPLMAEAIGRAILASLSGKKIRKKGYKLAIRRRGTSPKPSRVCSPDKIYLHMIGRLPLLTTVGGY
ncbi:DNA cytosine methyltransferase, partial [Methyloceanibacter sp.]|uniref:DNA cytosine methyltransferase n=1 Tax=Methyloceanibacter sp. TaxID=1965321 RepID=UPI003D6CCC53